MNIFIWYFCFIHARLGYTKMLILLSNRKWLWSISTGLNVNLTNICSRSFCLLPVLCSSVVEPACRVLRFSFSFYQMLKTSKSFQMNKWCTLQNACALKHGRCDNEWKSKSLSWNVASGEGGVSGGVLTTWDPSIGSNDSFFLLIVAVSCVSRVVGAAHRGQQTWSRQAKRESVHWGGHCESSPKQKEVKVSAKPRAARHPLLPHSRASEAARSWWVNWELTWWRPAVIIDRSSPKAKGGLMPTRPLPTCCSVTVVSRNWLPV